MHARHPLPATACACGRCRSLVPPMWVSCLLFCLPSGTCVLAARQIRFGVGGMAAPGNGSQGGGAAPDRQSDLDRSVQLSCGE